MLKKHAQSKAHAAPQRATQRLLMAKVAIPQPPPAPVRAHALEHLQQISEYPVTLLSAPAGSGKTTALAMWAAAAQMPVAWVSLDAGDNNPSRFWPYLLVALDTLLPGTRAPRHRKVHKTQTRFPETARSMLLNTLSAISNPIALVLDDYHLLTGDNRPLHEAVALLLDHLPPHVHIVLSSRSDPPLPLPRLRAHGLLLELRASDLRFTPAEAAAFFHTRLGQVLPQETLETLYDRAEGWVTGLQLAIISAQHQGIAQATAAFNGKNRYLMDYFTEEALRRLPVTLQMFLLQTSLLERLSAPLCDALCGITNSQEVLETLERANLFIEPLDEQRQGYRYHQLFAEVLRLRLEQALPERIPELYLRASVWCEAHGTLSEAIRYAFAAGNHERAARLLETFAISAQSDRAINTLREWLERLPNFLLRVRPLLCLTTARVLLASGQLDAGERYLLQAEATSSGKLRRSPASQYQLLRGALLATRATLTLMRGNVSQCIMLCKHSLEFLDPENLNREHILLTLGTAYSLNGNGVQARQILTEAIRLAEEQGNFPAKYQGLTSLAQTDLLQGHLQEARHLAQATIEDMTRRELTAEGAGMNIALGAALYEANDLDAAAHHLEQGIALSASTHAIAPLLMGYNWLAYVRRAQGADVAALELQERLGAEAQGQGGWISRFARASQARLNVLQGNLDTAAAWAREREQRPIPEEFPSALREWEELVITRVLLAEGRARPALEKLSVLQTDARAGERQHHFLESLVLQAAAHETLGETHTALIYLKRALLLAEREGFLRTIVDGGTPVKHLLALLRRAEQRRHDNDQPDHHGDYLDQLIAAFGPVGHEEELMEQETAPLLLSIAQHDTEAAPLVIEPLSKRELEVLRLLVRGDSNKEIANQLVIALGTVKRHINTIFLKLGVQSRTQAIAMAHKLQLVKPEPARLVRNYPPYHHHIARYPNA